METYIPLYAVHVLTICPDLSKQGVYIAMTLFIVYSYYTLVMLYIVVMWCFFCCKLQNDHDLSRGDVGILTRIWTNGNQFIMNITICAIYIWTNGISTGGVPSLRLCSGM